VGYNYFNRKGLEPELEHYGTPKKQRGLQITKQEVALKIASYRTIWEKINKIKK
jgi:hypothetical protein